MIEATSEFGNIIFRMMFIMGAIVVILFICIVYGIVWLFSKKSNKKEIS